MNDIGRTAGPKAERFDGNFKKKKYQCFYSDVENPAVVQT